MRTSVSLATVLIAAISGCADDSERGTSTSTSLGDDLDDTDGDDGDAARAFLRKVLVETGKVEVALRRIESVTAVGFQ